MRLLPLFIALTVGPVAAQRVVLDTRQDHPATELSLNQQRRILREVRGYDRLPACEGSEVRDELTGSFTRAGARQRAYLVMNCLTFAAEPQRKEYGRLVIYENGRIIRTLKNIGDAIGNIGDINGDRVDDLLFMTYFGPHMGRFSANASVVTLVGNSFRTFLDLEDVVLDTCTAFGAIESNDSRAHRVTVQTGRRPVFTDELYISACKANAPFRFAFSRRLISDLK